MGFEVLWTREEEEPSVEFLHHAEFDDIKDAETWYRYLPTTHKSLSREEKS